MRPIDYSIDVQNPMQAALAGLQSGLGLRQVMDQRAQAEAQRQQQEQMRADLDALAANPNPTAADYSRMAVRYPQLSEQFKRAWDMQAPERRQASLGFMGQVSAALHTGRADLAVTLLRDRATAAANSGDAQAAKALTDLASLAEASPDTAKLMSGNMLAAIEGGDKVLEGMLTAQRAPAELREAEAKATTAEVGIGKAKSEAISAEVAARFAESNAIKDLEKKNWDIRALAEDIEIKKQANRIAAMNAATAREGNSLKREELSLKVQEARQKLDGTIREKAAAAESGAASIDNMLNTIERIKKNPRLNDVVGGIEGRLPGVRDDSIDAIALIETLGSQAFLAQIPNIKGMGALSNAEGEKLQSALQNLGRKQSETQFRASLDEAARLLKKGRETLAKNSGVPLGKPDTPAAPGARPPLDSFIR